MTNEILEIPLLHVNDNPECQSFQSEAHVQVYVCTFYKLQLL